MGSAGYLLADAHVHFYDCFDRSVFLESAVLNFRSAADDLGLAPETPGVLLLSERAQEDYYRRWSAAAEEAAGRGWSFQKTAEECSLVACHERGARLYVVAGSQIATGDGLEILALASIREFADGQAFSETLDSVLSSGAITVLPWGFGKWSFGRGARVAAVVQSAEPDGLFLGDNANRLRWGPHPRLFRAANARGIRVLPGSDPLPFARHSTRAGSYGFAVPAPLDEERPAESLRKGLLEHGVQPPVYGELESLPRFCINQLALQWRKRTGSVRTPRSSRDPSTARGRQTR